MLSFYEPSEIADLLNCEHCLQSYGQYYPPRILPCCAKTICDTCAHQIQRQIKENKFKCSVCSKDSLMPINGFLVNNVVVKLITKQLKEISRGQEAEKLKQNLRDLEDLINKLVFEMENGEYFIKEDCRELRRQVQLAKEEKIEEINQQCDALFLKIDNYEEKCKQKYKEISEAKKKANELIKSVIQFNNKMNI